MNYYSITKDDMVNGDGLRVVLWVAGCDHCCDGCHNSYTWDKTGGCKFDNKAKQEIFDELEKKYVAGITFSGGDPLFCENRKTVLDFAKELKEKYPEKTIWLYTGFTWEEIKDLPNIDKVDVLVDGEFVIKLKEPTLKWKGSSNQRVIDVKKTIEAGDVVLYD
jgi:anaerobic ribonucleoside-triphosphate reductase activating protein